jgi:Mg-chelatase subunit ChlD
MTPALDSPALHRARRLVLLLAGACGAVAGPAAHAESPGGHAAHTSDKGAPHAGAGSAADGASFHDALRARAHRDDPRPEAFQEDPAIIEALGHKDDGDRKHAAPAPVAEGAQPAHGSAPAHAPAHAPAQAPAHAPAQAPRGSRARRTIIVVDDSGSMRKNDPTRLAEAAARLYLELQRPGDQLGLLAFSGPSKLLVPLGPAEAVGSSFRSRLAQLSRGGAITDVGRALDEALVALGPGSPQYEDTVLLLTDGQVDLGPRRVTELPAELRRITDSTALAYKKRHVAIHAVAFSPEADRELLSRLAALTRGEFRFTADAHRLHAAFSELFITATGAETLPLERGAFLMDESVKGTSLVLSKSAKGESTKLIGPDEEALQPGEARPGVTWSTSPGYDLVRLERPEPGEWRVEEPEGASGAMAIVDHSSLQIVVEITPERSTVDDAVTIAAELIEEGQRLSSFARLKSMVLEARVSSPSGKAQLVKLAPVPGKAGRFEAQLEQQEPGYHAVVLTVSSDRVQREKRDSFVVLPRCFTPRVIQDPSLLVLLERDRLCLPPEALQAEFRRELEGAAHPEPWQPMALMADGRTGAEVRPLAHGERGTVRVRVKVTLAEGASYSTDALVANLPEAKGEPLVPAVARRLAMINGPLAVLAGIWLVARRLKKRRASA